MEQVALINQIYSMLSIDPETIAVEYNEQSITRKQLLNVSHTLSQHFSKAGISTGMHVGLYMERCPEFVACLFALWQIQAVYIPLEPSLPSKRLAVIIDNAQIDYIVSQPSLQENITNLTVKQLIVMPIDFHAVQKTQTPSILKTNYDPQQLAYIIYTSGSSGTPKGVTITQQNIAGLLDSIQHTLPLSNKDVFIGLANFSFDISLFELLLPFLLGAKLVLLGTDDANNPIVITQHILKYGVSVIQATPSLWKLLSNENWNPQQQTITAISTGEALNPQLALQLLPRCKTLWNLYGPTEATIWATAYEVVKTDIDKQLVAFPSQAAPIGQAISKYQTYILDEHDKVIPTDNKTPGELCIAGIGLSPGYFQQPALTRLNFTTIKGLGSLYKTGDICSWNNRSQLIFHHRKDRQVKVNGYRIELEEIELLLESHASIACASASIRRLNEEQITILCVHIEPQKSMPNKTGTTFNQYLSQFLPSYMLPQQYYFVDKIPLTNSGKKNPQRLPINLVFENSNQDSFQGNDTILENTIENKIGQILCDVLEIDNIRLFDSFFDLGGNSMLCAALLLAVNNQFEVNLSLKQLLQSPPTVQTIYHLLQEKLASHSKVA